ncbi:MAG: YDG domain-containing protein [Coriobacteriales bacterium]|nr:YDG domain-containing protein [Coriobacteriales bacterium]
MSFLVFPTAAQAADAPFTETYTVKVRVHDASGFPATGDSIFALVLVVCLLVAGVASLLFFRALKGRLAYQGATYQGPAHLRVARVRGCARAATSGTPAQAAHLRVARVRGSNNFWVSAWHTLAARGHAALRGRHGIPFLIIVLVCALTMLLLVVSSRAFADSATQPALSLSIDKTSSLSATSAFGVGKQQTESSYARVEARLSQDVSGLSISLDGVQLSKEKTASFVLESPTQEGLNFSGLVAKAESSLAAGEYQVTVEATITDLRRDLFVEGTTAQDKVYDAALTTAIQNLGTLTGDIQEGDDVSLDTTAAKASFKDKDVTGDSKPVSFSGFALSGADAFRYALEQPKDATATITQATIGLTGVVVPDKTYDGTTDATVTNQGSLSGVYDGDDVSFFAAPTAYFTSKNAGTAKEVVLMGYSLDGADRHNYRWPDPLATTATIAPKPIGITGIYANNKTYDGTFAATVKDDITHPVLDTAALVSGDTVSLNSAATITATFVDKNAGTGKMVTFSGDLLTGADAANYAPQPESTPAQIAQRGLTFAGTALAYKTADGTTNAPSTDNIHIANPTSFNGLASGEGFTLSSAGVTHIATSFPSPEPGTWQDVMSYAGAFSLTSPKGGALSANYTFTQPPLSGLIDDYIELTVTASATDKTVEIYKYFANGFTINWGDGSSDRPYEYASATHTYAAAGTYHIRLTSDNHSQYQVWTFQHGDMSPLVSKGPSVTVSHFPKMTFFQTNATTAPNNFFVYFNFEGAITSLPDGSFDMLAITTVGTNFLGVFNYGGALTHLPASFVFPSLSAEEASKEGNFETVFNSQHVTLDRSATDIVGSCAAPSSPRKTFSSNQPGYAGLSSSWQAPVPS